MEDESDEVLEKLLAEQKQLLLKQEEKTEDLIKLVRNQERELEELRYLVSSEFRRLHNDIDYVLLRLSLKERVRGLIFKSLRLIHRGSFKNNDRRVNESGGTSATLVDKVAKQQPLAADEEPLQTKAKEIESWPLEMSVVMNWECNYNCSYCFAEKPKDKSEYRKHTADEWSDVLYSVYKKYGKCKIILTGGEPLLYKDAVDLVINATKYHHLSVGTNLSIHERFLQRIAEESNIENLFISASFHLEKASVEEFVNKSLLLKGKGIGIWLSAVAHPRYLTEMPIIRDKFEKKSLGIGFFPFIGKYMGRIYPAEYSDEELKILGKLPGWHERSGDLDQKAIKLPKVKGIRCYAGVKYVFVNPRGEVFRCVPVGRIIGNLFDGHFSTLRTPTRCPVEICDCELYWKYHLK